MAANGPPLVALPPLNNVINLPPQPQNPPVANDIAASQRYKKDIMVAHAERAVDDGVLADALTYDLKLLQARSGAAAAPPWFHLAMQQVLAPITQRLDNLTTLTNRLSALTTQSVRLSAISYNMQAASGTVRSLEVVPFHDGADPTLPPHNLPPLSNTAAVDTLNPQQTRDYYRGYYGLGGNLPAVERRKQLILQAIGCK